jgi:hypothetical protein
MSCDTSCGTQFNGRPEIGGDGPTVNRGPEYCIGGRMDDASHSLTRGLAPIRLDATDASVASNRVNRPGAVRLPLTGRET